MSVAKWVCVRYDGTDQPVLTSVAVTVVCPLQYCNNFTVRNVGSTIIYMFSMDPAFPGEVEIDPGVEQGFSAPDARSRWQLNENVCQLRTHGADVGNARLIFVE